MSDVTSRAERDRWAFLPEPLLASIRKNKVALKGPITTPVGSGVVKLKCELATGFTEPNIWLYLSVQPA